MGILDEFKDKDKKEFRKDYLQLMMVSSGIDRYYGRSNKQIDKYLPKYGMLIESFNNKYKNLKLELTKDIEKIRLRIFINEKSVKDVFSVANKIEGLKAIGAKKFNAANVENSEKFAKELMEVKNKIYISYDDGDIILEYDENEKLVELCYEEISDEKNPSFKLLSYYALKDGYDNSIRVYEKGAEFGFYELLTETEKDRWLGKFNPRTEE